MMDGQVMDRPINLENRDSEENESDLSLSRNVSTTIQYITRQLSSSED